MQTLFSIILRLTSCDRTRSSKPVRMSSRRRFDRFAAIKKQTVESCSTRYLVARLFWNSPCRVSTGEYHARYIVLPPIISRKKNRRNISSSKTMYRLSRPAATIRGLLAWVEFHAWSERYGTTSWLFYDFYPRSIETVFSIDRAFIQSLCSQRYSPGT